MKLYKSIRYRFIGICLLVSMFLSFSATAIGQDNGSTRTWLSRIADTTKVANLLIPGAHDAATGEGFYDREAAKYATTQDIPLALQFDSGIRAFDLRPVMHGDTLWIAHGRYTTRITFGEALRVIVSKLQENPSEFAIILVRNESDTEYGNGSWQSLMAQELGKVSDRLAEFKPDISVGELRGKILFFSRDAYTPPICGAMVDNWGDMTEMDTTLLTYPRGRSELIVQDYYETTGSKLQQKASAISRLMDLSTKSSNTDPIRFIFNYASGYALTDGTGYSLSAGYRANAEATSASTRAYINNYKETVQPRGVVFIDFAGVDLSEKYKVMGLTLTREIIRMNVEKSEI